MRHRLYWLCRIESLGVACVFGLGIVPSAAGQGPTRPVTLAEVLDSVRSRHPLIEASRAQVRAAEGSRASAGAFSNPVLSYDVENAPLPGRAAPPMDREAMTTATLPLEFLYQRPSRVRAANARVRAARADAIAASQRVTVDAVGAYYRTALAQLSLDIATDLGAWLDSLVAYNRARVEEGIAAEADLLRATLERDRVRADAALAEVDLAHARALLASFISDKAGVSAHLTVAVDSALLPFPTVAGARLPERLDETGALSLALGGRPDTRAARERVTAASADIATERSMLVRQLGATLGTKQSAGSTSLMAGVTIPIPLFDRNRGEVARATAEREAAAFELAAQERAVRADVDGAFEAARLLAERASALIAGDSLGLVAPRGAVAYLARADEARRIVLGAYREGAVSLLQVLDAARARGDARLAFFRTLYAQHQTVFELLHAEGIDLSAVPVALPR